MTIHYTTMTATIEAIRAANPKRVLIIGPDSEFTINRPEAGWLYIPTTRLITKGLRSH